MTTPFVATLVHESLGERVYKSLWDLILSQAYLPGSKLNVEQICRSLAVNRTPVWAAMRQPDTEGLVSTVARHGVFVLNYGVDKVRDLFHDLALTAARNQMLRKLLESVHGATAPLALSARATRLDRGRAPRDLRRRRPGRGSPTAAAPSGRH
jgi:DNA-binding GntR family transcriptional regulator